MVKCGEIMKDYKYSLEIMKQELESKYICPEIKYAFNASIEALEKQLPEVLYYKMIKLIIGMSVESAIILYLK